MGSLQMHFVGQDSCIKFPGVAEGNPCPAPLHPCSKAPEETAQEEAEGPSGPSCGVWTCGLTESSGEAPRRLSRGGPPRRRAHAQQGASPLRGAQDTGSLWVLIEMRNPPGWQCGGDPRTAGCHVCVSGCAHMYECAVCMYTCTSVRCVRVHACTCMSVLCACMNAYTCVCVCVSTREPRWRE